MDLSNPLRSVAPGVEGDVLAVLLRTHAPLTGRRVAALAERSVSQVREVLIRLAEQGLVGVERHGNTNAYWLNREHVLTQGLEQLADAMTLVRSRISSMIDGWVEPPVAVVMFGSAARHDGDASSDVDLLLVRPSRVDPDSDVWSSQRYALARSVESLTGNDTQVVELSESELVKAVKANEPLVAELREDGIVLTGTVAGL